MSSLIKPDFILFPLRNLGRVLPNPESNVGFCFDPLKLALPEELAGPAGDLFLDSADPVDAPTAEMVHWVVTQVNEQSARIQAFNDVEGKDVAEGQLVTSPKASTETYRWESDSVSGNANRGSFFLDNGKGSLFEYAKLDNELEVFATQSGTAPTRFVLFDRSEKSYTVIDQEELRAATKDDGYTTG